VGWGDVILEPGTAGQQSGTLPLSHHAFLPPPVGDWEVQILCSYWITDFSDLNQELLKTVQIKFRQFLNLPNMFLMNNFLLQSRHHSPERSNLAHFPKLWENQQAFGATRPK
jgi:hypothetical protein